MRTTDAKIFTLAGMSHNMIVKAEFCLSDNEIKIFLGATKVIVQDYITLLLNPMN